MKPTLFNLGVDRRELPRIRTSTEACLEEANKLLAPKWPTLIQESSPCGLRLQSEARLHPGEPLVLHVAGEAWPLHTHVVWVRESVPFSHGFRKTWIAGCRLDGESMAKVKFAAAPETLMAKSFTLGGKALWILGGITLVAFLAYFFVRLAIQIAGVPTSMEFR